MGTELIRLDVSKDEIGTLLDALEARIDYINEYGNPSDWEAGAAAYKLKMLFADVFRKFDILAAEQAEEDEG